MKHNDNQLQLIVDAQANHIALLEELVSSQKEVICVQQQQIESLEKTIQTQSDLLSEQRELCEKQKSCSIQSLPI